MLNRIDRAKEQQAMRRRIRVTLALRRLVPRDAQTKPPAAGKPAE